MDAAQAAAESATKFGRRFPDWKPAVMFSARDETPACQGREGVV